MFPLNYDNSKVTIELRDLVNSNDPITGSPVNIWNFSYPSYYTGADKLAFEQKVIDHYYFRQLGQETVGRWLYMFRSRIREIMPYYLQMYHSQEIMADIPDPFGNVDITDTYTEATSGTTTGETTGTATSSGTADDTITNTTNETQTDDRTVTNAGTTGGTRKFSNTPQGSISTLDNYMTEATVESGTTGNTETTDNTTARESEQTQTNESTTTGSSQTAGTAEETSAGSKTYTLHRQGNHGVNTYAHDMIEYRQTFLNVDMMIINELADLFLQVY